MFNEIGYALIRMEASPAEALLSLSLFTDTMMTVRVNNPQWFEKATLQEVLGIRGGKENEDSKG